MMMTGEEAITIALGGGALIGIAFLVSRICTRIIFHEVRPQPLDYESYGDIPTIPTELHNGGGTL